MNNFWSMSGNFLQRITLNPSFTRREESFPIPLKYIDVTRTTNTNLDVKQEKRIDDYWNIDGSRDLSDPLTGFTQFTLLEEKPPNGKMWSRVRLTRKQLTSRPDHLWPELWDQSWRTHESHEVSVPSTQRTRILRLSSIMHGRNWKYRPFRLCLAEGQKFQNW